MPSNPENSTENRYPPKPQSDKFVKPRIQISSDRHSESMSNSPYGRTVLVSPIDAGPSCTCYDEYSPPPPPRYSEREMYYDEEPQQYVLKTVVPGGRRRRRYQKLDCKEIGINCLGGMVYGSANCLAATVEICAAFVGGVFQSCTGRPRRRRIEGEPYSWKNYDVGSYEYDMVVYRKPRRNCVQKMFDC